MLAKCRPIRAVTTCREPRTRNEQVSRSFPGTVPFLSHSLERCRCSMKRTVFFSAIFGSFALTSAALAGNDQQDSESSEAALAPMVGISVEDIVGDDEDNKESDRPSRRRRFGRLGKIGQIVEHFTKDDDKEQNPPTIPIDPGKGDGKPTLEIPTRPGYVWVGDHWEREKAPQVTTPQGRPGFVWVGDHWERVKADGSNVGPTLIAQPNVVGPVVRDHRTTTSPYVVSGGNQGGIVIRDHRTPEAKITVDASQASGGVVVTTSPRRPRKPATSSGDVTGHGPLDGIVDGIGDGIGGIGDALGDALGSAGNAVAIGHGTITPAGPAQPAYKAPASATVRDHRN